MDEIKTIKAELREDCGNPFYEFCKAIVDPMAERIYVMNLNGFTLPEEYPEPISWNEVFKIVWNWGLAMTRESEIRPILAECRNLLS